MYQSHLNPAYSFLIPGKVLNLVRSAGHPCCVTGHSTPLGGLTDKSTWKAVLAPLVEFAGAAGTVPEFVSPPSTSLNL